MTHRPCKGKTKRGLPCNGGAQAGSDFCGPHQDQADMPEGRHVCREGYLIEVLVAVLRAVDTPDQPGETQRLADVTQIVTAALHEMGLRGRLT